MTPTTQIVPDTSSTKSIHNFLILFLWIEKQITFPEHVPISEVQRGIKSGKYLQGTFQASRENYLEANVFVQDSEKYNQVN